MIFSDEFKKVANHSEDKHNIWIMKPVLFINRSQNVRGKEYLFSIR